MTTIKIPDNLISRITKRTSDTALSFCDFCEKQIVSGFVFNMDNFRYSVQCCDDCLKKAKSN